LHQADAVTSATLMAWAAATGEAIEMARRAPSLGVGCHVVLVDGEPVLPAEQIPSLIDQNTGRFHATLGAFLRRLLAGQVRPAEIEAEAKAQIELLQAEGLTLTHIDTHKHVHMFAAVLGPVLNAAKQRGIRAIRNPFEPAWSLRATQGGPWVRRTEVTLLRRLQPAWMKRVHTAGFATTDGLLGVVATGTLDAATLSSLLRAMPEGTWELVTHPGYCDEELARVRTRLLESRETEREALLSMREFATIERISFADFQNETRTCP
jgi:predicted glycoside hydrolase/deacetylase ChbG (UPF0249 family)